MTKDIMVRKILLVDDEIGFAELLRDLLSMDNYEVEVANDGLEGLEKIAKFQPQVIISDVVMPRMSGFEMFKKVKANLLSATKRKKTDLSITSTMLVFFS